MMKKQVKWMVVLSAACLLAACGGGGGESHNLKGTWNGYLYGEGPMSLTIDREGDVTELLFNGSPSTSFLGGSVEGGPGTYTMTWELDPQGSVSFPFLTDEEQIQDPAVEHIHGSVIYMFAPLALIGTVERNGSATTTFYGDDILGSWSGYGYAYSHAVLDFAPFSPVTVEGVDDTPLDTFTVSLPAATIEGVITESVSAYYWGSASTGAEVIMVMSPDKQYVTVEAVPPGFSGDLEDLTFFSLNRD